MTKCLELMGQATRKLRVRLAPAMGKANGQKHPATMMAFVLCFATALLVCFSEAVPARPKHIFAVIVDDLGRLAKNRSLHGQRLFDIS